MSKLLSAHQPVYLPWLGFFHKLIVSDLFVVFDDVPYSKKMWYNRNFINGINNKILLSVPVKFKTSQETKHKDILIDNTKNWQSEHWKSIYISYSKYPYFYKYEKDLKKFYEKKWSKLVDLNTSLLFKLLEWLKIKKKIIRASDYNLKQKKSDLIIEMCLALKQKNYLFGELGKNYCDFNKFKKFKIKPYFQNYNHPKYKVLNKRKFYENLSVLDLLFYYGDKSVDIILKNNLSKEEILNENHEKNQ